MTSVLLVEDDPEGVRAVSDVLSGLAGAALCDVATNRDDAIAQIAAKFYDLLILDLSIPANDSDMQLRPENGMAVFGKARELAAGMPVFFLTASSTGSLVRRFLRTAASVDIWASGRVPTINLLPKLELDDLAKEVSPYIEGPELLEAVELDRGGVEISFEQDRLLRIFSRGHESTKCIVAERLGGGLSGAAVLRVRLLNSHGKPVLHAIAKFSSIAATLDEVGRYERYVTRLAAGATPRKIAALEYGAKSTGGVFYSLEDGHDSNCLSLPAHGSDAVRGNAIRSVAERLKRWGDEAHESQMPIRRVRQRLVTDEELGALCERFPISWVVDFEKRIAQTKWGCVHGDCHGGNILIREDGTPAVIDYGDVGEGALSLDPVALELSVFFHPQGALTQSAWPDADTARRWGNLQEYLKGCPVPHYVTECRAWADSVSAGRRELAASAYAYLIRQLKYPETNKGRALALLEGVRELYNTT